MPYSNTDPALPFSGNALIPRECSREAAHAKAERFGARTMQYLAWLHHIGLCTDMGAAESIPLPIQSICSIRNAVMRRGLVECVGKTEGRYRLQVSIYQLTAMGRNLVQTRQGER